MLLVSVNVLEDVNQIGNEAAEVINLVALAIQSGVTTSELEQVFLVHPSASVALQRCAAMFR